MTKSKAAGGVFALALCAGVTGVQPRAFGAPPAPQPPNYTIQRLGFTGPGYEYSYLGGVARGHLGVTLLSPSGGYAAGASFRCDTAGNSRGTDAWLFNGTATVPVGLVGAGYEYAAPSGTFRFGDLKTVTSAGAVFGTSNRYTSAGVLVGADAWVSNGVSTQMIGLGGAEWQTTQSGAIKRESFIYDVNAGGSAVGWTHRYLDDGAGTPGGRDAWLYNGTTTINLSLTDSEHQYMPLGSTVPYRSASATKLNAAGYVIGSADRMFGQTDLGEDAWVYNGSSTTVIGLTGAGYVFSNAARVTRHNDANLLNASGQVVGNAIRYNFSGMYRGTDAWLYNGSTTTMVGLVGGEYQYTVSGDIHRANVGLRFNDAGQIVGRSARFTSDGRDRGQDAWFQNGVGGVAQMVGLSGGPYEYTHPLGYTVRLGEPQKLTQSGKLVGHNKIFAPNGQDFGKDAWFFSGSGTAQRVSLAGGVYEYALGGGTVRAAQAVDINEAGQVVGYNGRFPAASGDLGRAGWFFDDDTGVTTPLEFSFRNDGYSFTDPKVLMADGGVLGAFTLFDGATSLGNHLFRWKLGEGFSDLGALVGGGLSASGWQALTNANGGFSDASGVAATGWPQFVVGEGITTGQTGGSTAYLLTAQVPEPSAALLAFVVGASVLVRRRRGGRARMLPSRRF